MARKRRPKDHKERIHEEMLRYLDENPLPASPDPESRPKPARRATERKGRENAEASERRPRLMLRKMPRELALQSLERFVHTWRHRGVDQVIVVVGKGLGSAGGLAVLGPAVREWLDQHPEQVRGHEEAPLREGGSGAILVHLRP